MARVIVSGKVGVYDAEIIELEGNLTVDEQWFWLLDAAQAAIRAKQVEYAPKEELDQPRRPDVP